MKKKIAECNVTNKDTMWCGMQLKYTIPWPPQPEDLNPDKVCIPDILKLLLNTVFNGRGCSQTARSSRLMLSIAEDIIYATSKGKIRTPKNILLPSLVKSLTNSIEMITILDCGHGISYSLLMDGQTEHAYEILEEQLTNQCIIPKQAGMEEFTIFVADNIDRNEETFSVCFATC